MREDSCTCRLISVTDEVISSVAEATDWTLVDASSMPRPRCRTAPG
jgi:hypothetical protein